MDADSNKYDAILGTMFRMTYNLVPFVRSLRTTGCRARLCLFVDNAVLRKMDKPLSTLIDNCGVTLINIGDLELARNEMLLIRNVILCDFLRHRMYLFDRILIVDLYDTIFQGDPFHRKFDRDSVGFSLETRRCDRGQIRWATLLVGKERSAVFWNSSCINVGTIVGGVAPVTRFLEVYVDYLMAIPPDILAKIVWIPDQVVINSMIHTNVVSDAGIRIRYYQSFDEYHIMLYLFDRPNLTYAVGHYREFQNGSYPLVVHLFDRSKRFCRSVPNVCPQMFPMQDSYVRCQNKYS
jgi:hypothetical protein